MTLAALIILSFEIAAIRAILLKYVRPDEDPIEVEEFISRTSLEDFIRMRHHTIISFLAFCLLSVCCAMRIGL